MADLKLNQFQDASPDENTYLAGYDGDLLQEQRYRMDTVIGYLNGTLNFPKYTELSNVAFSGNYSELNNKPTTSNIPEGTNLYFTDARVYNASKNQLKPGTNITLAFNDTAKTVTINSSMQGTGTVTSVGLTSSYTAGLTVTGGPITTSGVMTINLSASLQGWASMNPAGPVNVGQLGVSSLSSSGNIRWYDPAVGNTSAGLRFFFLNTAGMNGLNINTCNDDGSWRKNRFNIPRDSSLPVQIDGGTAWFSGNLASPADTTKGAIIAGNGFAWEFRAGPVPQEVSSWQWGTFVIRAYDESGNNVRSFGRRVVAGTDASSIATGLRSQLGGVDRAFIEWYLNSFRVCGHDGSLVTSFEASNFTVYKPVVVTNSGNSQLDFYSAQGGRTMRLISNTDGQMGIYGATNGAWALRFDTNLQAYFGAGINASGLSISGAGTVNGALNVGGELTTSKVTSTSGYFGADVNHHITTGQAGLDQMVFRVYAGVYYWQNAATGRNIMHVTNPGVLYLEGDGVWLGWNTGANATYGRSGDGMCFRIQGDAAGVVAPDGGWGARYGRDTGDWIVRSWVYAANFALHSDRRIKRHLDYLDGSDLLSSYLKLAPARFEKHGNVELGFYAQDVKEHFPELVTIKDESDYGGFSDMHHLINGGLEAPTVAVVQELIRRVERLTHELAELRG